MTDWVTVGRVAVASGLATISVASREPVASGVPTMTSFAASTRPFTDADSTRNNFGTANSSEPVGSDCGSMANSTIASNRPRVRLTVEVCR